VTAAQYADVHGDLVSIVVLLAILVLIGIASMLLNAFK
jgi:hypothetical protein